MNTIDVPSVFALPAPPPELWANDTAPHASPKTTAMGSPFHRTVFDGFIRRFSEEEQLHRLRYVSVTDICELRSYPNELDYIHGQFGAAVFQEIAAVTDRETAPLIGVVQVTPLESETVEIVFGEEGIGGQYAFARFEGLVDLGPESSRQTVEHLLERSLVSLWSVEGAVQILEIESAEDVEAAGIIIAGSDSPVCDSPYWRWPENRDGLYPH